MNAQNRLAAILSKTVEQSATVSAVQNFMEQCNSGYEIVLFGAGNQGQVMRRTLEDAKIQVKFFCDNNALLWGRSINGIPCISPAQLQALDKVIVCIASGYINEIKAQLNQLGIEHVYELGEYTVRLTAQEIDNIVENKDKFLQVLDLLESEFSKQVYILGIAQWFNGVLEFPKEYISGNQYFDESVYILHDDEVLIDAGAYNGDTIETFCKITDNKYEKIYAFELNAINYEQLVGNITEDNNLDKIVCFNKGVGNADAKIYYSNSDTASQINDKKPSSLLGEICKIDNTIEYASLIKMDIEGAELEALMGAEHLIRKHKPKLAICIYHKPRDFFEIPLYIKELVPEYKFAVRHYTSVETETVLYAYIEG